MLAEERVGDTERVGPIIAYTLWGNGDLDLIEQIDWLKTRDFEAVAFHTNERLAPRRGLDLESMTEARWARLREATAGLGALEVHAPIQDEMSLVALDEGVRSGAVGRMGRHLRFAHALGAQMVVFHSGKPEPGTTWDQRRVALARSLTELAALAEETATPLSLEVADDLVRAERFDLLRESGYERIGICLDVGHLALESEGRPGYAAYGSTPAFIHHWGSRITHVHLHDYDGARDHVGLGAGILDLNGILRALNEVNYTGMLTLELSPEAVPPDQVPEQRELLLGLLSDLPRR